MAALERRILERTVAIHKYLFPNASFPYIEWVPRRTPWPINSNSEANSEKTNTQSYSKSLEAGVEASSNPFEDLKDEDVYTLFEPKLPSDAVGFPRTKATDSLKISGERREETQQPYLSEPSTEKVSWKVLDLRGDNYFSCAVANVGMLLDHQTKLWHF
ncbi:Trehalose-6-P synthase/phosphatase complex synthase subunit [Sarracenia purpurea var. burkii]